MLTANYSELANKLNQILDQDRVHTDYLRRVAWGTDASFYQKRPQIVVHPKTEAEVAASLAECHANKTPVTFRAAGTALCGQAISDSILMVAGSGWDKYEVLDGGARMKLQAGVIGAKVNQVLNPLGWKFGPDPATIASAMVSGIVANNASGMNCGTHHNAYRLIESARIVMANGFVLDTASEASRKEFAAKHPEVIKGIEQIRDEIAADEEMTARIKRKYSIKNVTGFGMNSFVDFHDPFDIMLRLMVGSEGTLGFLSEVTMKSVVKSSHSASAMVYFDSLRGACEAIVELRKDAFDETNAAELLDNFALKAVAASKYQTPDFLNDIHKDVTAVLFETFGMSQEEIDANIAKMTAIMAKHGLYKPAEFTQVGSEIANMWAIRKAVFPLAGSMRPAGTSCIIEDIAFPIEVLPQATIDLQNLSFEHGYNDAVIYGHALEGNYHVIFSQDFSTQAEIDRFDNFMAAVVELVATKYDGSLKAEHGTGFGMAAFVEKEWGSNIYGMMKRVKKVMDPSGILNPGVIINDDPHCHSKGFKPLPKVHDLIDKCIECGFCEQHCVAHSLTMSPRQRTAVARVMKTLETTGKEPEVLADLQANYRYYAMDTCAADGLCKLGCPMGIDTGKFIKKQRAKYATSMDKKIANFTANQYDNLEGVARFALGATDIARAVIGEGGMGAVTGLARKIMPGMPIPQWTEGMPKRGKALPEMSTKGDTKAVYFPACLNRMLGTAPSNKDQRSIPETIKSLFEKANIEMLCGEKPQGLCCGQSWESYGHDEQADRKSDELSKWLLEVSNNGEHPILVETTACLERMRRACDKRLNMLGPEEFAMQFMVDKLDITKIEEKIAVHPTCTCRKMGIVDDLVGLAKLCASDVVVPERDKVGCCGMAGNRGMNYPELNAHGLRNLKAETKDKGCTSGYSVSATCEIGLTTHSGIPYKNILTLLDKASKAKA
ncbi:MULTISPECIES: FAD-binding and (Fe-S)-binding domain-containing protein [Ferrimonas]|uniref:FAD-binding and (Fe-S)-binding domain-containing protein n=1 Tax=Ferrimonas TaxID=44011 RepID=UPI000419B32F|nr:MULTISPECIES: FAD-binding and (Fe-S)-binding domain-containing protein [Ferrimonas]USD38857.1 FAD-binding oxidoreductase [Ferrimonas sp. SCSIO 43195]